MSLMYPPLKTYIGSHFREAYSEASAYLQKSLIDVPKEPCEYTKKSPINITIEPNDYQKSPMNIPEEPYKSLKEILPWLALARDSEASTYLQKKPYSFTKRAL